MIVEQFLSATQDIIDCSSVVSVERVGGMTNKNYKVVEEIDDNQNKYIVRLVGDSVGSMIDRDEECTNILELKKAFDRGEVTSIVLPDYIDQEGLKITKYIEHSNMDVSDSSKLVLALETLKELHTSDVEFLRTRTCFDLAETYRAKLKYLMFENKCEDVSCKLAKLDRLIPLDKLLKLEEEYLKLFNEDYKPCHIDTVPDNFFVCEDRALLNDFEYACMSDSYWDIVNLLSESGYTSLKDMVTSVSIYTGKVVSAKDIRRLHILNLMNSYCWYLWSLIDEIMNTESDTSYGDTKLNDLCDKLLKEGI